MTSSAEITAQIDLIEANPRYQLLLTSSRGTFENREFQQYQLQLGTLRLRRDDLTKREHLINPPAAKAASPLIAPSEKKRSDILVQPNKAIPDPPAERKALFPAKVRSAHLQAPTGPKVHNVTNSPQQNLLVTPGTNVLPPPKDTSMPPARKSPVYSMPPVPAPDITNPAVIADAETGKITKAPTTIAPPVSTTTVRTPPAGRVAPSGLRADGTVEPPMLVGKPKGLAKLVVVAPTSVEKPKPAKVEDAERAAARKALTTEVEAVDYLDSIDLAVGDDSFDDNIINDLASINDMDDIGLESEPVPEPAVEPPKPKKAAKKSAAKKGAAKKTTV